MGSGFISFASSHITVQEDGSTEYTSVQIPFVRDGGTSGDVVAIWEVCVYYIATLSAYFYAC